MCLFNRPVFRIVLVFVLALLMGGCALRSMFGNVIIVEDIGEEINEIITTVFSDSTAAVCLDTDYGYYECTYILNGMILTSTFYLLSEYGITGVLIDPVILQVPADVTGITATYDDGTGPEPLMRTVTPSFYVTPSLTISAETDHQFIILELPPSVTDNLPGGDPNIAPEFSYSLTFTRTQPIGAPIEPITVKIMLAGKTVINEYRYYVPLVPCVTDFSLIPELEIPQSDTPIDLEPAIADLIALGGNVICDHEAYYFDNVPPPPLKTYLPVIVR